MAIWPLKNVLNISWQSFSSCWSPAAFSSSTFTCLARPSLAVFAQAKCFSNSSCFDANSPSFCSKSLCLNAADAPHSRKWAKNQLIHPTQKCLKRAVHPKSSELTEQAGYRFGCEKTVNTNEQNKALGTFPFADWKLRFCLLHLKVSDLLLEDPGNHTSYCNWLVICNYFWWWSLCALSLYDFVTELSIFNKYQ